MKMEDVAGIRAVYEELKKCICNQNEISKKDKQNSPKEKSGR